MNARDRDAAPSDGVRRAAGAAARVLAQGLLLLAGLATVALGFTWFVDTYDEAGRYRTAPACGTAAAVAGTDCVLGETGRVAARKRDDSGDSTSYELTVARETAPRETFDVGEAFYDDTEIGTNVDLKVWRGRVAEVSYHGHRAQNPDTPWLTSVEVAFLIGLGSVLTVYGLTWPRDNARSVPVFAALWVVAFSFAGCVILVQIQLPFALTLGIPVLGWVLMTAGTTAVTLDT
ncbi:hypothetical protein ACFQ6N_34675 [Kitasatospora sp. NPDC056446]|uniref:hypothetical protein n=1 Tax=Kitasatospora sp. NPDC056446 TaxID=3345819 RepID=UPI00369EAAEF